METKHINDVIERLLENDDMHAILISGAWGIGKTYNVEQFVQKHKDTKKLKIAYSSIFGKNSIDEINTELYQIFHPETKIINLVSKAVKLVNFGAKLSTGLNLNINTNIEKETKQDLKRKKKNTSLIILDDFERKSDKISADELLGFINGLIIQGFKIVVLADLNTQYGRENKIYAISEIKSDSDEKASKKFISKINWDDELLGTYKEKVFDRIYEITESPNDVIKLIFGDYYNLLNEKMYLELDNNIRMAAKVNSLFKQIRLYMKNKKYNSSEMDIILKICLYVVIEFMTSKYSKILKKQNTNNVFSNFTGNGLVNTLSHYDATLQNKYELICAINNIYLNEDYRLLDEIYNPTENDRFLESCFYASDSNKILQIKKQFDYIMKIPGKEECNYSLINQLIRDWYNCCYYLDLSFIDKNKLFNKLNKLNFNLDTIGYGYDTKELMNVVNEYKTFRKEQNFKDIKTKLMSNDNTKIKDVLYNIHQWLPTSDEETKLFLIDLFKSNNFFLQKIAKDITPQDWTINHLVCQIISEILTDCKSDLYQHLLRIQKQNKNDKSCSKRIDSLIKQYKLETNS